MCQADCIKIILQIVLVQVASWKHSPDKWRNASERFIFLNRSFQQGCAVGMHLFQDYLAALGSVEEVASNKLLSVLVKSQTPNRVVARVPLRVQA
jgi:hypothetical protein